MGDELIRVGLELIKSLTSPGSLSMIILPSSFLADDQSLNLRKDLFTQDTVYTIDYYPAEAKLFGKADVDSTAIILE